MLKRGQVSVFVIIGTVILLAMVFVFVLFRSFQEKAREITNPQEYLRSQLGDIKKVVNKCIDDSSRNALNQLYLQGGYFNPTKYLDYRGNKTAFLCYKVKDNLPCYNMVFTRQDVAGQLRPKLEQDVKNCIDLSSFRDKDYTLTTGEYGLDFTFSDEALLVNVDYPITLTKGNITQTEDRFTKEVKTGFWNVAALASQIVGMESNGVSPDIVELSSKNLEYEVGRTEINGNSLYLLKSRIGDDSIFYFAVEK